jgi:hypothetical protein
MNVKEKKNCNKVRVQILTAASIKMAVFWEVAPCSLVEVYLMMEAASTSETSVNFYQATRRNIAEDSHVQFVAKLCLS